MKVLIHEERLSELIKSSLALMCKTSLRYDSEVEIKGLLGITLDKTNVFLVDVKELIRSDEYGYSDDEEEEEDLDSSLHDEYIPHSQPRGSRRGSGQKKTKQKKTKKRKSKGTSMKENMTKKGLRKLSFNEIMMEDANKQDPVDMGTHTPQIEQNQVEADSDADAELDYSVVKVEKHDAVSIDNPDYSPNIDGEDNADGAGNCITDTSDFNDESVSNAKGEYPNKTNDSNVPEYMEDIKAAADIDAYSMAVTETTNPLLCDNIYSSNVDIFKVSQETLLQSSSIKSEQDDDTFESNGKNETCPSKPNVKRKQHCCSICSYKTYTSFNLQRHLNAKHKGTKLAVVYNCPHCSNSFADKYSLKQHISIKHGAKSLICSCHGKKFRSVHGLKGHIAMAKGESNFRCEYCTKYFVSKFSYSVHMKMHLGLKEYVCRICATKFSDKMIYKTHYKECKERKRAAAVICQLPAQYKCEVCSLIFQSDKTLKVHIQGKHDSSNSTYQCQVCCRSFKWRASRDRHVREKKCNLSIIPKGTQSGQ